MISYDDKNSQGTLSITEYASKSLGDVVFVELPKEGTQVAKGGTFGDLYTSRVSTRIYGGNTEQIGAVESVKAASDIVQSYRAAFQGHTDNTPHLTVCTSIWDCRGDQQSPERTPWVDELVSGDRR